MSNLIPLEDAAKMLGLSVDKLNELRSNSEIFGYKDGPSWKFKLSEIERVAGELDIDLNATAVAPGAGAVSGTGGADSDMGLDLDSEDSQASDVLNLEDSGAYNLQDSGQLNLEDSGSILDSGEDDLSFGSSDINLASDSSSKSLEASDTGNLLDDVEEKSGSPSDTGALSGVEEMYLSEDDLFDDELVVQDSESYEDSVDLSSDFDDSSDLVMDDSDSSTEVTLEANESGIALGTDESGISLSDSMELGGSDIDALELPDDDDMILVDASSDPDAVTMMQDDDFNLTAVEQVMDEEETSGSQIIALEDSELYTDESSATILAPSSGDIPYQPSLLPDDGLQGVGMGPGGAIMPGAVYAPPESPYTVWQIGSLVLALAILLPGAMVAYDLARNLWIPDDQVVQSGVMKILLSLVGMD